MLLMFAALLLIEREIYQQTPPIPANVKTPAGDVVSTRQDIKLGRNVRQSLGGMQQGSIWRHGGYLAPDWTAD
jgi:nitric oxide reductase subunit B